jgi:hypothetical protein
MTVLVGKDGAQYDIPEGNAQAAIASGQFSLPSAPAPEAAPAPPPGAPAIPQAAGSTGADVASAAGSSPEQQAAAAERAAHAHDQPEIFDVPLLGEDGKLYTIPDENIPAALQSGKFRVSTLEERQAAQAESTRAEEIERAGGTGLKPYIGGTLDAALTGAGVHNPFFGIAEAASGKGFQEAAEQAKDVVSAEHPVGYGAGAVAGEVGSALGEGQLAKGVAAGVGLARPVGAGAKIAKAALEGAVFSAEPVAKGIINKDPAASAEALALGIGLNVALHGAFEGLAKLPGLAASTVEKVEGFAKSKLFPEVTQEEAENIIGKKVLGLTPAKIAQTREEIAPALKAAGVTAEDVAGGKALEKIQKLEESGPAIGRAIKELDTFEGKAPILEEHLGNAQAELRKLLPSEVLEKEGAEASLKAGRLALKEAATSSERLAARGIISEAESRLQAVGKLSPLAEQASKALQPILEQIDAAAGKGTFEETQALKKFIGGQTNFAADNGFQNQLRKRAYGIVAENVARAEDAVAGELGSASVVQGLREQRGAYALHKMFGDAADRLAARQVPEDLTHLLGGPHTGSGHMLPHFVLHAFGLPAGVNAALAVTGIPQLVKGYVQKQALRGAAAKLLQESTAPTTNTLVHALERQNLSLSEATKGFFASLGTREAERPLDTSGGLRGFVEDANGRSHRQQLSSLQRLVTQAQTDPGTVAARLDKVVAPLQAEGLHEVAQAYTDHQLRLMKVLQAILPKEDLTAKAHPFAAKVDAGEISPATRAHYQRALTIAADPTALLHLVKSNQITQGDVAIAAAVNPSTLQKLRDEVIREGMKSKPDLTYQQRLSMGILLGQHIDESTEKIPALQSVYSAAASGASAPQPSGHSKSGKLSAGASANLTNAPLTLSQQAAGHSR